MKQFQKHELLRVMCPESVYNNSIVEVLRTHYETGNVVYVNGGRMPTYLCRIVMTAADHPATQVHIRHTHLRRLTDEEGELFTDPHRLG
jgi:hypothetical protein